MVRRVLVTVMFVAAVGWYTASDAAAQPALADHRIMVSEHIVLREIGSKLKQSFQPVAIKAIHVPEALDVGEEVLFSAQVNVEHATLPITARWEFDDGTTLTGLVVRRSFTEPGQYRVHFHVANRGSEASRMLEIEVQPSKPGDST